MAALKMPSHVSQLVIGEDFIFAGVWDGHGGTPCSEYCEQELYKNFKDALGKEASTGPGRVVALHYSSSMLYQIH